MPQFIVLLLAVTLIIKAVLSQTAARANTCCGLMSGKVYCYGGFIFTSTTDYKVDNVMNVLDITNSSGTTSSDLQNMWKPVSYIANNVDLTPRTDPQCLVISDESRLIINGGYYASQELVNKSIMYNALQNKWYSHSSYSDAPYGDRQIYYGSASYVPGKGAAFFGGFEVYANPNWTVPYTNASVFSFANGQSRTIGYTQVSYFNVDNAASTWVKPVPFTTAVDQFSARHTSVFDPVDNLLYFMGGEYRTTDPPSQKGIPRPYSYVKTFNTETNAWSFVNLTGEVPAAGRIYSTLTLLPSTNRHVLLYGGEVGDSVALDYCFVLNLDTKNWTKQAITAPAGTILARSRHSSVLVNNNTLFVIWGIDSNKVGTSSVLILNTTNPDLITMSSKYIGPNPSNGDRNSGLSGGAKAGIAVGVASVAILGAFAIWFCIRKKKKNEKVRAQEQRLAEQQQSEYFNRAEIEPREYDWDQIEDKYPEMPTSNFANTNADNLGSVASPTLADGGGIGPSSAMPTVHPDGVEIHHPHTIDTPQPPRVLKPDGGY
ncbi:hypothetical protein BD408DRAFT_420116 [Parasitella parasitica]|nr:hypothetical protein BD408DRAFT_420116 [Parasitella parasitica]